ncbi:glycerate kinase [Altibacter sp. HG106]|uniref:glycerate kinase n=1 Tax=Altibacter sp. HG106 TaxID=3023937 RepID=UPI00235057A2|nr:glycerate kinase [Altibacter sp. HG106]MDC7995621.1 glycerate kinase [Altibacter sp. HG106]
MKVLLAPDAFKDSLTAQEAAEAMKRGVLAFNSKANTHTMAVSDGGEGFLAAVARYQPHVESVVVVTTDPLGRSIEATYLWDSKEHRAYVELAAASGIELLTLAERDALKTSTLGTGVLLQHAIEKGATSIFLGIGGSATNDGGIGIAHALGYRFKNKDNELLEPKGASLDQIGEIVAPKEPLSNVRFVAINDVQNPLFGPRGAAYTFAKQKGASDATIERLDQGLRNLDANVQRYLQQQQASTPGSGAAGGTGFGLKVFFGAEFIKGTEFIFTLSGLETLLSENDIDLIITGEGKIDAQTSHGKFINGLTELAKKYRIPVYAVCGKLEMNEQELARLGLTAARELYDPKLPEGYSYTHAKNLIQARVVEMLRKEYTATPQ